MGEWIFYAGIAGVVIVILLPLFAAAWAKFRGLFPTTAATPTVTTAIDAAGRWASYAAARAAIGELRIVDFTSANLDIHAELDALESKIALALKSAQSAT
jgi:hypothetical protein